jgi:peptidoglycan hydrolase CwlO-like protein
MLKKLINSSLAIVMIAGVIGFTGCSGISDEQVAELESLRSEVKALDKEVNSLKAEKAAIEKEIADKNAKLEQCAKYNAEVKANLEKIAK